MWLLLLPCLTLAELDNCFERVRNHTLIGTVLGVLNDVTLPQCQQACLEARKQSCRSFMYDTAKSRCYMNSEDKETRDSSLFSLLDAVDYYHRICYHTTRMESKSSTRRDSAFDDKCYETIEGKVLIGIVDQLIKDVVTLEQCKKRCQKSKEANGINCKSAIYYEKEKLSCRMVALLNECAFEEKEDASRFALVDFVMNLDDYLRSADCSPAYSEQRWHWGNLYLTSDSIEGECIIASQSRKDIPDLFVDDDQATYLENTCLSNNTSEVKEIQSITFTEDMGASIGTSTPTEVSSTLAEVQYKTGKPPVSNVELSGYEAPIDTESGNAAVTDITAADADSTTTVSPTDEPTTIDVRVIDTYNVDVAVKSPTEISFGKRLRDSRVKECFTEVRPLRPMDQTRVTKAYSLEQCTDICRLCWRCLHGKKCLGVAFDISLEQCALSSSPIIDGGDLNTLDPIVYHNRIDC
uniref:Apple domain-containing protein n=1 Tax=Angiostrongylus cantonensis TaxID=6313 RepID=A0A158PCD7_ANGCA